MRCPWTLLCALGAGTGVQQSPWGPCGTGCWDQAGGTRSAPPWNRGH